MSDKSASNSRKPSDTGQSSGIAILDFLFTFALASGLVPATIGLESSGLLSEQWIKNPAWPLWAELDEVLTLLFAVVTLTFSWYGYHDSIRLKPHRAGTWQGFSRFQIDVVLILLYGILLLLFRHVDWALAIGAVIYGLYAIWDGLEASEYEERFSRNRKLSVIWFVIFAVLWALTWRLSFPALLAALSAIVASIAYRVLKLRWAENIDHESSPDDRSKSRLPVGGASILTGGVEQSVS